MKELKTVFLFFCFTASIFYDNVGSTHSCIDDVNDNQNCDSLGVEIAVDGYTTETNLTFDDDSSLDSSEGIVSVPITNDLLPLTVNPHLEVIDEKYAKCGDIDIRELSVLDFQNLFQSNRLTSVKLTKCYLERLDRMNPVMRAVIEVNPDVLKEAEAMDLERSTGQNRGRMHGIPVLLKESIGTVDKTETTCGSQALIGIRPKREAAVVTRLKQAGAVIMGKSNLPEFYGMRATNTPEGWSSRGGQPRNAYNLSVTPSVSSSGSAISVAANLVAVSVGTETDGSIIGPAGINGIVGLKPTFGLLSVAGVIPLSPSMDNVGPMGRTVMDTTILLDAMISEHERPQNHPSSYAQSLQENNVQRRFRVGVLRYPFWDTAVIDSPNLRYQLPQLQNILNVMNSSDNFEVLDPVEATFQNISYSKVYTILLHELKQSLNEYLTNDVVNDYPVNRPSNPFTETPEAYYTEIAPSKKIASLQDIIDWNEEHPVPEGYNQEHYLNAQATDGILNETYIEAKESNKLAAKGFIDSVFEKYQLDAIVVPSEYRVDDILKDDLKDFTIFGFTVACIVGYPSINIPAGIGLENVPFGMNFISKPYTEPTLLKLAYTIEQLSPQRRPTTFLI